MRLSTYQSCSRAEKRLLLTTFWSRTSCTNPKVTLASTEYGPVAYALILIATAELVVLSALLLWQHHYAEAAIAGFVTLIGAWSTWWTKRCQSTARHYLAIERGLPDIH